MNENSVEIHGKEDDCIEESFEEILSGYEVENETGIEIETEPLCASCFAPLNIDEGQTIAYCDRCQTTVFVERRMCHSSL